MHENLYSFWAGHTATSELPDGADRWTIYGRKDYRGVITRISWSWQDQEFKGGGPNTVKVRDITDGLSHTFVIGEKAAIPKGVCGW